MKLSIIIPTYNAGPDIRELIKRLLVQTVQPFEIIVIDSSSTDETVAIAEELGAKTRIIPQKLFNHGSTRNDAAKEASGDVLVFMTQDAIPADNQLLYHLSRPLQQTLIAGAFARHVPKTAASLLERFAREFNYPEQGSIKGLEDVTMFGIKTFFFSNVCSAINRELFFKAGMFPDGIRANEDMIISAKLMRDGYKIAYVPEAKIFHSHNYSLIEQYHRYYNIGSSLKYNKWILGYAKAEGKGIQYLGEQLRFVMKKKIFSVIPYIFLETIAKYIGFRIGVIVG